MTLFRRVDDTFIETTDGLHRFHRDGPAHIRVDLATGSVWVGFGVDKAVLVREMTLVEWVSYRVGRSPLWKCLSVRSAVDSDDDDSGVWNSIDPILAEFLQLYYGGSGRLRLQIVTDKHCCIIGRSDGVPDFLYSALQDYETLYFLRNINVWSTDGNGDMQDFQITYTMRAAAGSWPPVPVDDLFEALRAGPAPWEGGEFLVWRLSLRDFAFARRDAILGVHHLAGEGHVMLCIADSARMVNIGSNVDVYALVRMLYHVEPSRIEGNLIGDEAQPYALQISPDYFLLNPNSTMHYTTDMTRCNDLCCFLNRKWRIEDISDDANVCVIMPGIVFHRNAPAYLLQSPAAAAAVLDGYTAFENVCYRGRDALAYAGTSDGSDDTAHAEVRAARHQLSIIVRGAPFVASGPPVPDAASVVALVRNV